MKQNYIVMAHRSAASVLGAANSPCKNSDGKVIVWPEREMAEQYCNRLNAECKSSNVSYTVEAWYDES
jgi:hypothetical protein